MDPCDVDRVLALPPDEAMQRIVGMPEDQWFERASGRVRVRDLAVPLVAMANAEGGYLVVGIHDGAADGVPLRGSRFVVQGLCGIRDGDRVDAAAFDRPVGMADHRPALFL